MYVRPEEKDEREQDLVESAPEQQLEFQAFIIAAEVADDKYDDGIKQPQQQFDLGEATEVFREVVGVLRDSAAVEVGDAEVEQNIKEVGEVEESLIGAVGGIAEQVLHLAVDAEDPERFHQQVEKQQEDDIFDEAVLHLLNLCLVVWYNNHSCSLLPESSSFSLFSSGKAFLSFSGISFAVVYVATPIGLSYF